MPLLKTGNMSQKRFASPLAIGTIPGYRQPENSLDAPGTSSQVSGVSTARSDWLREGDLVTGIINVTHERAYMVSAIRNPERAEEKARLVCVNLSPADNLA